jgi:hypothetical protein
MFNAKLVLDDGSRWIIWNCRIGGKPVIDADMLSRPDSSGRGRTAGVFVDRYPKVWIRDYFISQF